MTTKQRDKVSTLLAESTAPLTAGEIASRLGLHVTTARFHLTNLVDDGLAETTSLPSAGVGRPRVGFRAVREAPIGSLLAHLLGRLGSTAATRELAAAEAGRLWADEQVVTETANDLPDPVTVASDSLEQLGFRVSGVMSAFGTHELRLCSCPLKDIARTHPEVARGVARGVIEQVLAASSPVLASQYAVAVSPDPAGGDCEIMLRLTPLRSGAPAPTSLFR
ncbi:helix-turn-helix domain-containing protein [Gordonia terrae]|uniref:helix-turn-helix transcriptional regulator n=1 Tax=Gordonia terrae TaxID=2055 RepID=UPI00200A2BD2|nr:helix-turn-helix domain-containing protein [Gordonia terrae]UPW09958.1 helix-turn-helix domain-containing protein [Gordonia terrae]